LDIVISTICVGFHFKAEGFSAPYVSFDLPAPARTFVFGHGLGLPDTNSHNRNKTDPQATVVYVGSRLFVPESTSDFLDCVGDKPRS